MALFSKPKLSCRIKNESQKALDKSCRVSPSNQLEKKCINFPCKTENIKKRLRVSLIDFTSYFTAVSMLILFSFQQQINVWKIQNCSCKTSCFMILLFIVQGNEVK